MREAANLVKWDPMLLVDRTAWNWDSYVKHLLQRAVNPDSGLVMYAYETQRDAIGKQL